MKTASIFALFAVVAVMVAVAPRAEAATCDVTQLVPCAGAIQGTAVPSGVCCGKLKEQKPCLCGYLKNPSLRSYVNSPNAKKVAAYCRVQYPRC